MKNNKVIGLLLLILAISTIVGMVINNAIFWSIYNYATIIFSIISGIVLLKQK
ncbi:MAG: hypothetical protein ISS34_07475 [Candidatus Omnitrophica bacterium]|nr:hypothetical protein [Candidatus Omnitrophota bacterium]